MKLLTKIQNHLHLLVILEELHVLKAYLKTEKKKNNSIDQCIKKKFILISR